MLRRSIRHAAIVSTLVIVVVGAPIRAGDSTPHFLWSSPDSGGDWFDPTNWSPKGVPGAGAFVQSDATIDFDATSPRTIFSALQVDLRDFVLRADAEVSVAESFRVRGDMTFDRGRIDFTPPASRTFWVEGNAVLGAGALLDLRSGSARFGGRFLNEGTITGTSIELDRTTEGEPEVNRGTIDVNGFFGGLFRNEGLFEVNPKEVNLYEFTNTGTLYLHRRDAQNTARARFGKTFHNYGKVLTVGDDIVIDAEDMIHDGSISVANPGAGPITLTLNGDQMITPNASFDSRYRLVFNGLTHQRIFRGDLDLSNDVEFLATTWTFRDDVTLRGDAKFGDFETIRLTFESAVSLATAAFESREVRFVGPVYASDSLTFDVDVSAVFEGALHANGATTFRAQSVSFQDADVSFNGPTLFDRTTAQFASTLHVDGALTVTGNSTIITSDNRVTSSGPLTWSSPTNDLTVELQSAGLVILGVRRVNARVEGASIRVGAGTTELNTDLFADQQVLIAGANLSIGAVGEIAHRTIHGDLGTTFALSQAWDFDIEGSGSRGIADSDTLTITGDATIYGILRVQAIGDPSDLRAGDEFTLFAADSIDATFRFVSLPALQNDLSLALLIDQTSVRVLVVPTPGVASLLAISAFATIRRRRPR